MKRLCLVAVASLTAPDVAAQNLIVNADFDQGLSSPWGAYISNGAMVSVNAADGSDRVPSMQLTADGGQIALIGQCVPLAVDPPPQPWDMGLRVRVVSSTGTPISEFQVEFQSTSCEVPSDGIFLSLDAAGPVSGVQGDFIHYALTGVADPMPGGNPSQSVWITARVQGQLDSGITVNVDKFYVGPTGTTPVELTHFVVD